MNRLADAREGHQQLHSLNAVWSFHLQKTNTIRDYLEDVTATPVPRWGNLDAYRPRISDPGHKGLVMHVIKAYLMSPSFIIEDSVGSVRLSVVVLHAQVVSKQGKFSLTSRARSDAYVQEQPLMHAGLPDIELLVVQQP